MQGLAPYWFEVEASAYVESSGRTHVRVETEYDLLLTNRLVLQPLLELEIYGRADPERRIGAGLSSGEIGLRLRYEFRREFAPYRRRGVEPQVLRHRRLRGGGGRTYQRGTGRRRGQVLDVTRRRHVARPRVC